MTLQTVRARLNFFFPCTDSSRLRCERMVFLSSTLVCDTANLDSRLWISKGVVLRRYKRMLKHDIGQSLPSFPFFTSCASKLHHNPS
jgi:hypothetical protein